MVRHSRFLGALASAAVLLLTLACQHGQAVPTRDATTLGAGPHVFLSPTGDDADPCSQAEPCRSFERGYRVAPLGGTVQLAPGVYPEQVLEGRAAKATHLARAEQVVFRPAPGATVEVGALEIRVPHVEFRDMRIAKYKARYDTRKPEMYAAGNLTFRNIRTHHLSLTSVHHVRILGGEVGPNRNPTTGDHPQDGIFIGAYPEDAHVPTDILIEGVDVHDITEPTSTAHSDCIQFTAGVDVVVRSNQFRRCEHAGMMIKADQGPIDRFLIENNFLDRTLSAHYSINMNSTSRGCGTVLIRNNTALQNIRSESCAGATITGNIQSSMSRHSCSQAIAKLSWNVYESGIPCGRGDRVAAVAFVDRAGFDLHLARGSSAIGRGNPHSAPAKDVDGDPRPRRAFPDAGADQREPAGIDVQSAIGAVRVGARRSAVEEHYGAARSVRRGGGATTAFYPVPGGRLWAQYRNDRVVGVGTSSRYYSTSKGLGPGVRLSGPWLTRLPWDACRRAHRRHVGPTTVYYAAGNGKPPRILQSVAMFKRGAEAACVR